jgi:NADPH-dependent 2,4-dienoyl-CoA reductase/sulfur reductase-like enzyme
MDLVVIGGSDAGISAGLRARELDPDWRVTLIVADEYPNFSICGIPYLISGDVVDWRDLAHRTHADLVDAGLQLRLGTRASAIDPTRREVSVVAADGRPETVSYDALVVGTGAVPLVPPIAGLTGPGALGPGDGLHVLHTMGETFGLVADIARRQPCTALIVGAGYISVEMAEALTARGIQVTQVDQLPEVLPTVDADLGALVRGELVRNGVTVSTTTQVSRISRREGGLRVDGRTADGPTGWDVDLVLVVTGVTPDTGLLTAAGAPTGPRGALVVDESMATGLPDVWAAGDCVVTHHRQLGVTYLPLGTTAHKQGRVAGANAVGASARFAGSLGTQVVKVFDLVVARTGLRDHEAAPLGHQPTTITSSPNDHKAYYPGANPITISVTGDARDGRLLGAQLVGRLGAEISKRVDIYASALFHDMTVADIADLDLSYTPPLGSPWDAVQMAAQQWESKVAIDRTVVR